MQYCPAKASKVLQNALALSCIYKYQGWQVWSTARIYLEIWCLLG